MQYLIHTAYTKHIYVIEQSMVSLRTSLESTYILMRGQSLKIRIIKKLWIFTILVRLIFSSFFKIWYLRSYQLLILLLFDTTLLCNCVFLFPDLVHHCTSKLHKFFFSPSNDIESISPMNTKAPRFLFLYYTIKSV